MKPNIIIFSLEPLNSRYTEQWHKYVPELLNKELDDKFNIIQIDGDTNSGIPTQGAFLDFLSTNQWKNEQANKFFEMVKNGIIQKGDHLLFTDAWNPTIIEMKYVSDLMKMDLKIHALWHAGAYDPADFLGRLIGNTPWVRHAEKSFFHSIDYNYFATDFHINMFVTNLFGPWYDAEAVEEEDTKAGAISHFINTKKIIRSGWPMAYLSDTLDAYKNLPKRDLIVFPHRIAPEKQVEIFRDLAKHLPQYEFVVCQDTQLTKHEYHTLLGEAKMVFSANLQETLGISTCSEGPLVNAIPLAPNRLSYAEIFKDHKNFLYPSHWTENWKAYETYRPNLMHVIIKCMSNYNKLVTDIKHYNDTTMNNYFSADILVDNFKRLGVSI